MTLLDQILAKLSRGDCSDAKWPDAKGEYWPLCPFHADAHSGSFAVGERGFKCFSCEASGSLRQLAGYLGVAPLHGCAEGATQHSFISVETYAEATRLDLAFLHKLGLRDSEYRGEQRVLIPYLDPNGNVVAKRYRLSLQGPRRFLWAPRSKVHLYGLWRLQDAVDQGYIILVEGESDCHTLWQHGLPVARARSRW